MNSPTLAFARVGSLSIISHSSAVMRVEDPQDAAPSPTKCLTDGKTPVVISPPINPRTYADAISEIMAGS